MPKSERAIIAAERIRDATAKEGDIREFMKSVLDFLSNRR